MRQWELKALLLILCLASAGFYYAFCCRNMAGTPHQVKLRALKESIGA